MIEGQLVNKPAFCVLGIQERINPMAADYRELWSRFEDHFPEVSALASEEAGYGVYFDCGEPGKCDFVAGMHVPADAPTIGGLVAREVPAAEYSVFECPMTGIGPAWGEIFQSWLPSSGREIDDGKPSFERFCPGCREGRVPVQIFVALKPM